ncbi:MAG: TonB-dependent receptor [Syntrophaceae bacterium]|nr:TonB-dependent receptor [Syntrophaceae bacterium]
MKSLVVLVCFIVALTFLTVPVTAFSAVNPDSAETYTMGEVVVSAERAGVESIGTIREVTGEDIRNQGARNLSEALALVPGVNIRIGAQGVPRVDMRGLRGRHVILLLDGIPFNSTYDGQFDPSIIGVENIAKIKVNYGNHSVLYGDGGLGGIINIVTKKGQEGVHGMAATEVGDRNTYFGKFSMSGAQDKMDFLVSGSGYRTSGFGLSDDFDETPYEDGGLRENSDKKNLNLFANLGYSFNEKLKVGFVAQSVKGEYGIPPSTINGQTDDFASNLKYERMEDLEGYSAQVSAEVQATEAFMLRSWLFMNRLDEEKKAYDNDQYDTMIDPKVKTYEENNQTKIYGINLQAIYDFKSAGQLALGLGARQEKWDTDGRIRDVKIGKDYFFRNFDFDRENEIYTAALEYTFSPVDNLSVVLGYSHHWLEKDSDDNDDEGSYLAGVYYNLFPGTRLRGSYARKIRFPSISQLYDETSGNPDLEPEMSDNYELGIIQDLPFNSTLEITAFYLDVEDYIEKDNLSEINENNQQYVFRGVEVTAETRFIRNLMLRLGYSFMEAEDKSDDAGSSDLQYRPKHKLTLEGQYAFDFGLSAYLSMMHYRGQFCFSRKDSSEKKDFNDYTVVSGKVSQVVWKDFVSLYAGVDNILDEDYEESYGFPQEGRFFYGGVEFRF